MFKNINIKENIKDWKFWFKLFSMLLILFAVMWDLIMVIINPAKEFIYEYNGKLIYNSVGSLVSYLSFFTIQSNLLVVLWFIVAIIFHDQEGEHKILKPKIAMFVAVYITITMLIFNLVLLPELYMNTDKSASMYPGNWSWFMWFKQMILHLVGPLLFIVYVLFFMKASEIKGTKEFIKTDSWKVFFYPLAYGIYILIRVEIRIAMGMPTTGSSTYPYFFMNLRNAWPSFLVIIVILVGLGIGLSTLYNFIISKRIKSN